MSNNSDKLKEIEELKKRISKLREEIEEEKSEDYQWLIGKCIRSSYTSRDLITAVTNVSTSEEDGSVDIAYECVSVYFYDNEGEKSASITLNGYGTTDERFLKDTIVELSEFLNHLQKADRAITSRIAKVTCTDNKNENGN
jgi:cell division septum initiation protein DivIVA